MNYKPNRWLRPLQLLLFAVAIAMMAGFLFMSHALVVGLSEREEARMRLWAGATEALLSSEESCDLTFVQKVIEDNRTIPLLLTDEDYRVLSTRNVDDRGLSDSDLRQMALRFASKHTPIVIELPGVGHQLICYDDSDMLKKLAYFPLVQILVVLVFVLLLVAVVRLVSRAEKDKLWVGLSLETAHQLGTPISSLMAWAELLESRYPDDSLLPEMQRDVTRLRSVAERFSQIGSRSELAPYPLGEAVASAVGYMRRRVSDKVDICLEIKQEAEVMLNAPLFEWIIENLCKNAVDAMAGVGTIAICVQTKGNKMYVDIADNGKGMDSRTARHAFDPGFTTKKRGWGLGLALTRRIISEYHDGRIYILRTEIGKGSVFRIELNKIRKPMGRI